MKRCMYCGNENDDSSQNCSKCGNKLLDLPPQQSMMAEEVPEEEASLLQETENETQDIQISEDSLENAAFQPEIGREEEPAQEESAESQAEEEYEQDEEAFGGAEGYQQQYGGRDYFQGYPGETNVQQQYGGQAYGYEQQPQQYGYGAEEEQENYDYGQTRQPVSGNGPLMTAARKAVRSPLFFPGNFIPDGDGGSFCVKSRSGRCDSQHECHAGYSTGSIRFQYGDPLYEWNH